MTHFLAINYTIPVGSQQMQGNMIYPSTPDTHLQDIEVFKSAYPLADVAFYTLSSIPSNMPVQPYPLNRS